MPLVLTEVSKILIPMIMKVLEKADNLNREVFKILIQPSCLNIVHKSTLIHICFWHMNSLLLITFL